MKDKNFSLVFFTTRALYLGIVFSLMFNTTGSDSIISCLLGIIMGLGIIALLHKIKTDNNFSKTIEILLYLFYLILSIIVLETFINSFLLFNTPKILTIIPTIVLGCYAASKGMKTIKNTASILVIISIPTLLLISLSLSGYISLNNILPLGVNKLNTILLSAFYFAILSAAPNFLVVKEGISLKKHLIYYLITSLINSAIAFIILATLTPEVAKLYSFPEYMVLKRIKIFEFIENVENFTSSVCYLDMFIFVALTIKRITDLCKNKLLAGILIWGCTIITTLLINNNYFNVLYIYHASPFVLAALIIFLLVFSIKKELFISNEKYK